MPTSRTEHFSRLQSAPYARPGPSQSRLPLLPRLEDMMSFSLNELIHDHRDARPNNTKKAYDTRQTEWYAWCDERTEYNFQGSLRYLVTQEKLAFFLQSYVLKKRRLRKRAESPKQDLSAVDEAPILTVALEPLQPCSPSTSTSPAIQITTTTSICATSDPDNDTTTVTTFTIPSPDAVPAPEFEHELDDAIEDALDGEALGPSSIKLYVAAMVDLWRQQQSQGSNSHPNPRGGPVATLLQTLCIRQAQQHKLAYKDRGKGTLLDGISHTEQLAKLAIDGLQRNSVEGIRDRLMMLLLHSALFRGDDARRIELADLHSLVLDSDSTHTRCVALIATMRNGKTNQGGHLQMAGILRNKEVEICSVGALALHLFCKFHLGAHPRIDNAKGRDQFPDFTSNKTWYDLKLFPSPSSATTSIKYETQRKNFKDAFVRQGIDSSKVTHLMRSTGARMAELGGAAADDIRRSGRWEQSAMITCYLSKLPRQTMHTLAGFSPDGGDYWLPRDVPVPEDLLNEVFPLAPLRLKEELMKESPSSAQGNMAAVGFLQLLLELRTVLLQDAVLLRRKYPQHFLFRHPLFKTDKFNKFSDTMLASMPQQVDPIEKTLKPAFPFPFNWPMMRV